MIVYNEIDSECMCVTREGEKEEKRRNLTGSIQLGFSYTYQQRDDVLDGLDFARGLQIDWLLWKQNVNREREILCVYGECACAYVYMCVYNVLYINVMRDRRERGRECV